jgi:hypothetical protein
MRPLVQGVATAIRLRGAGKIVSIPAIYSPGVETSSGLKQWIFWEMRRSITTDKLRIWSARAYSAPNHHSEMPRFPISIASFDGESGVDTDSLSGLLIATGLAQTVLAPLLIAQMAAFVEQTDYECTRDCAQSVWERRTYFNRSSLDQDKQQLAPQ